MADYWSNIRPKQGVPLFMHSLAVNPYIQDGKIGLKIKHPCILRCKAYIWNHMGMTHECDRQTNGWTDRRYRLTNSICCASLLAWPKLLSVSLHKKTAMYFKSQ